MDLGTIVTAAVSAAGGVAGERLRQWMSSQNVRNAIGAEIQPVLVTLNFYILKAMEGRHRDRALVEQYFGQSMKLQSFEFYWHSQREKVLGLPEWPRLKNWVESLGRIGDDPDSALFNAIMLFESFVVPPLEKCLSRDTRTFVRCVLDRPEVASYKRDQLMQKAGLV
jgi:hypothetical protein